MPFAIREIAREEAAEQVVVTVTTKHQGRGQIRRVAAVERGQAIVSAVAVDGDRALEELMQLNAVISVPSIGADDGRRDCLDDVITMAPANGLDGKELIVFI